MNVILILFLYVIIVNIVGFAMMGIDKRKAKRGAFRIPEAQSFSHRPGGRKHRLYRRDVYLPS